MARKKHDIPEWLPFGIAASAFVALVAGARAGWRLSGDRSTPPSTTPPQVQQGGVLRDWFAGDYRI